MDHVEVEVKLRVPCSQLELIANRAIQAGGKVEGPLEEIDVYYQHPCRDLKVSDEALRVRYVNGSPRSITYKGPREAGQFKARREVIVDVGSDPDVLLRQLGFEPAIRVSKARTYIRLGNVELTLDNVEGLGCFVEVESLRGKDEDVSAAIKALDIRGEVVNRTYAELVAELSSGSVRST
ncbi:Adenylate cyclase [Acidilobus saccharovorans 345-15]|uniref:Adenylate cyclase n=1 Tax=Acidilobus saccharovorans (strain DSM 16705 / JCM 18335 / VKM B-2471 / 345-15) TaxID=666510 RepID=D9Q2S9_ACIS3|nr:class IV adenylate cyclase [Acidilobus saccharovorans]ADL19617.1 Adenylate cyclase [Acidilobus saccharovorans 345-15]